MPSSNNLNNLIRKFNRIQILRLGAHITSRMGVYSVSESPEKQLLHYLYALLYHLDSAYIDLSDDKMEADPVTVYSKVYATWDLEVGKYLPRYNVDPEVIDELQVFCNGLKGMSLEEMKSITDRFKEISDIVFDLIRMFETM